MGLNHSPVLFQMSGNGQDERRPPVTPLPDSEARGAWSPVLPMNYRSKSAPRWSQTGDKAGVRRDLGMNYIEIRDAGAVLESKNVDMKSKYLCLGFISQFTWNGSSQLFGPELGKGLAPSVSCHYLLFQTIVRFNPVERMNPGGSD